MIDTIYLYFYFYFQKVTVEKFQKFTKLYYSSPTRKNNPWKFNILTPRNTFTVLQRTTA